MPLMFHDESIVIKCVRAYVRLNAIRTYIQIRWEWNWPSEYNIGTSWSNNRGPETDVFENVW